MKTCDELVIGQQLESHISPTLILSKEIEAFQAEMIIRLIYNNYIFQIYCSSTCNCIPALCRIIWKSLEIFHLLHLHTCDFYLFIITTSYYPLGIETTNNL